MEQSMIDEPVTVGQLIDGELFEYKDEVFEVLENRGTKYVLCQRKRDLDLLNIQHNQVVEPI
jgi:hypothetical protein